VLIAEQRLYVAARNGYSVDRGINLAGEPRDEIRTRSETLTSRASTLEPQVL